MTQLFFSEYNAESLNSGPQPIVIFGAGGLGREVQLLLTQLNQAGASWEVRGFYDDHRPAAGTIGGLPYLGTSLDLNATSEPLAVAVAVGHSAARAGVVSRLTSPLLSFPVLVHPGVTLGSEQRVALGAGCIIQAGCLLTCDITMGRFVLLNLGCTVGHDAVLDDFCSLMPHANVGGAVHLQQGVYMGTGSTIIQGITIGEFAVLGAGGVAVRNIAARTTAVGVPARDMKRVKS